MTLLVPLTILCLIRLSHKSTLLFVLTPYHPCPLLYCSSMRWRWYSSTVPSRFLLNHGYIRVLHQSFTETVLFNNVLSLAWQVHTVCCSCIAYTYPAIVYLCEFVCTCFSEVTRV